MDASVNSNGAIEEKFIIAVIGLFSYFSISYGPVLV